MTYKIMKEAVLNDLKENIAVNKVLYNSFENEGFLKDLQIDNNEQNPLLEVEDILNKSKEDLANAIKLYEYFKELPLTLASDEKFWTYLTHTSFWDYMCKRWPLSEAEGDEIIFIKTRYFFDAKNKTFYRNGLSRLWWYAHLTYDSTEKDPYHYTRIVLSSQDLANLIIASPTIARNKTVLKALLEVAVKMKEYEETNKIKKLKNMRGFLRKLARYINLVGGVTVWDNLNQEEAYSKLWNFVEAQFEYITDIKAEEYIVK